jgi:hypothetical protein
MGGEFLPADRRYLAIPLAIPGLKNGACPSPAASAPPRYTQFLSNPNETYIILISSERRRTCRSRFSISIFYVKILTISNLVLDTVVR